MGEVMTKKLFAVAAIVLGVMSISGLACAAEGTQSEQWQKIAGPDGIIVEYQADRLDVAKQLVPEIAKRLKDSEKRISSIREAVQSIAKNREQILKFLADQMGLDAPSKEMIQILENLPNDAADKMIAGLPTIKHAKIWNSETLKARLIAGEKVPGFVLNPETQKVEKSMNFQMGFNVGGGQAPHAFGKVESTALPVLVKSTSDKEALAEAFEQLDSVNTLYNIFTPVVCGSLCHEAAESGIVANFHLVSPYRRWFCDGMANYLAARCLEKFVNKEAAQEFLKTYDTSKIQGMKDQIDLQYWRAGEWEEQSPVRIDKPTENAAYAFSLKEISGLADRHGTEVIPAIFKELAKTSQPDDEAIINAVEIASKENFRRILSSYGSKAPKDKFSRLAIRGVKLGTNNPNSPESLEVDKSHKVTLVADGQHGVSIMIAFAIPEPPITMQMELIGPPKSSGETPRRSFDGELSGKGGVVSKCFMFPDDIDQPGKYTIKISFDKRLYKEVEFEVVAAK
jgi:hypothetical protein